MRRRSPKRNCFWRIIVYLLVTLAVALGSAFVWLNGEVRSADALKPYVQKAITQAFSPFVVEADDIRYVLDGDEWTLVTGLHGVTLRDGEGHRVAAFSEINLNLRLLSLLSGQLRFDALEIVKPAIRLHRQADGRVTLSVAAQEEEEASAQEEEEVDIGIGSVVEGLRRLAVRNVVVRDGLLGIVSRKKAAVYRLPRLVLVTRERGDVFSIQYDVQMKEDDAISRLTGSIDVDRQARDFSFSAALTDFDVAIVAPFHRYGKYLAQTQARLSGAVKAAATYEGRLLEAQADLALKDARLGYSRWFEEPVRLSEVVLKAAMARGESVLRIEKAYVKSADFSMQAEGDLTFRKDGLAADLMVEAKEVKIDRVGAYWPKGISADARDWVTTNLSVGTVTEAKAKLKFTPEDLAAQEVPGALLDADLTVKNATVGFLSGYPLVKGVDGQVKITARSLDIVADKGDFMRATTLTAAHLHIPDFSAQGIPMEFSLTLDASAADVAEMIGPKRLNLASALKLDPALAEGRAKGTVEFTLPLYSADWPADKPYIAYDVTAALEDVSQDGVLGKWDIRGMSGNLAVDNKTLSLKTRTQLQDAPAELGISREFTGGEMTVYTLVADIPREIMPRFGFTIPENIQGVLGVDAKVTETASSSVTAAKVDLSEAAIAIPELNYAKPSGAAAVMTLTQEARGAQNVVPKFAYDAQGAQVRGSYAQDRKTGDFVSVALDTLKLANNDFALTYKMEAGRKIASVKGAVLDISTPERKEGEAPAPKEDKNPLDGLLNMRLELGLDKLILSPDHGLSKLSGVIDCGAKLCHSVDLRSATENGKPFVVTIAGGAQGRSLSMTSPDAGGVVKAFDISDHVVGGALDFKGSYDDAGVHPVLNGRLIMTDFRVVKGPILAKLLSLASLTGFLDALSGKGIAFTKLSADAKFSDTTLRVKKGKAFGSAIGLTVEGKIKPFMGMIDLKGTVVPAYTANSVLGKIPLLGKILTGGEGEGIIAANYSMKGDGDDPSVMVNPLSLLTPGFLRNLFDVFDAPDREDEEKHAPAAPAADAPKPLRNAFPSVKKR